MGGDGPSMTSATSSHVPELASAYGKLTWARFMHSRTVLAFHHYFELEPCRFEAYPRQEEQRLVFTSHETENPEAVLVEHGMLLNAAADVVHAARCALDHLAYALARFQSPYASEKKLFGVTFQIITDQAQWKPEGRLNHLMSQRRRAWRNSRCFAPATTAAFYARGWCDCRS